MVSQVASFVEERRLAMQARLDADKTQAERNQMGQFATPSELAQEVLQYGISKLGEGPRIRFLDPAIGTGSFYSALRRVAGEDRVEVAVGYEVDPHYGEAAAELWRDTGLLLRLEDFTRAQPTAEVGGFNLLICNPPYVRHHHMSSDEKVRLRMCARAACGVEISGLA
ncbi:MAG: hypothetical protein ACK5AZ_26925 [Bryobacteraceae bacterium]